MGKIMKKWALMSVLFLGMSLAVYAIVAPEVSIESITLLRVTSTSADVMVESTGAVSLLLQVCTPEGDVITQYLGYPGGTSPSDGFYSFYNIAGLSPDTEYLIRVTGRGYPNEDGDANTAILTRTITTISGL